jgi:hypothetical protein
MLACPTSLVPEGPASTQVGEVLAAATSPNSSILSSEALVEAGVGTFEDLVTMSFHIRPHSLFLSKHTISG